MTAAASVNDLLAVIALIGEPMLGRKAGQERCGLRVLGCRSWRQKKPHGIAPGIPGRMECCRQAAVRTAQGFPPPVCASPRLVSPNEGGIHQDIFTVWIIGKGLEYPFPDTGLRPPVLALEYTVPCADDVRELAPVRPGPCDPAHRIHTCSGSRGRPPGIARCPRQQLLDGRPLSVPELASCHPLLPWVLIHATQPTLQRGTLNVIRP